MTERKYARLMGMYYRYNPEEGTLTFEDGVKYTVKEAMTVSKVPGNERDLAALHTVKSIFHGEVIGAGRAVNRPPFRRDALVSPRMSGRGQAVPEKKVVYTVRKNLSNTLPDAEQIRMDL
jgi:hypothetical protein